MAPIMKRALLFFILLSLTSLCFAQKQFNLGNIYQLYSKELKENRTLNIYLPEGYQLDSTLSYPVIYLLDGSANEDFVHIVGLVQFLTMIEAMPKTIVVGIANVDRKRDFTYPTTIAKDKKDFPTTGSSAPFINFIANELQPFVQKNYRTNRSKTIIGQSLGGLLATEILLKKPDLFSDYVIISPSLWWDNESLLTKAPSLLKNRKNQVNKVYIGVGKEGKQMEEDAKKLMQLISQNPQNQIKSTFEFLPKENHLTILHNSAYSALIKLNTKK